MLQVPEESTWECYHTATSEPYFHDQSYTQVNHDGLDGKDIHSYMYVILQKKSVRGKMNQGGPKNGIALLSVRSHCRGVQKHCKSQSYLSGKHAKPCARFGGY